MVFAVIDTNVIVSALLAQNRNDSAPFSVLNAVFRGVIVPIASNAIIEEYQEVLNREKFGFDKKKIEQFLNQFKAQASIINPPRTNKTLPDKKDVCFYEAAMVYLELGGILITGDIKHFPDCQFAVTPAQIKEKLKL